MRRYYAAGSLEGKRVTELEALGMVWSAWDTAWAHGLAVEPKRDNCHRGGLVVTGICSGGGRLASMWWASWSA
ncbi:hypothetical protein OK006_8913 [Actinobacteria bacterium OK006]|nr:hypothetical protein OK006_8913 [Actinobacteria bacterium OK006]